MKKFFSIFALGAALLMAQPLESQAQTGIDVGLRGGGDLGEVEGLFVGGEVRLSTQALPVIIAPGINYYFVEEGTFLQIDANALYEFGIDNQVFTPYAGAGVGISYANEVVVDDDGGQADLDGTDIGANILFGLYLGTGQLRPYAQVRTKFGGTEVTTAAAGILYRF